MRTSLLKPPAVLTFTFAAASLGCGACADDHLPAASSAPEPGAVLATEVRGACALGLARPAGGFAAIVEIPSLGGNKVFVEDINDDGVAVGAESTADGVFHAIRYTDLGGVQDLGALSGFSGGQSFASAIAANGTIAGHSDRGDGSGLLYGYAFTATAGRTALCPGGCSVWDLNAAGQMVGLLPGQNPTSWQAFLYSTAGGLRPLGTLGGARSSASGISEAGLVVGNAQLASSPPGDLGHAFLYDSRADKPQMRDLNTVARAPGWVLQAANDVNEKFVVGYGMSGGNQRAFRLDLATGAVQDLGTTPGGGPSVAWSVDVYGDVVGWAESPRGGRNEALVYAAGLGGGQRLGDLVSPALGWTLVQANGINAHGSIVGWGYHQGAPRGFKLTLPVCVGK
jgi:probable HAF family extracellular repeat protein